MYNQAGTSTDVLDNASMPCLLRIKRDIADFTTDPPPGIFLAPEENDVRNINAIVMGAQGTPLEGGFFHLFVQCTNRYPLEPPKVRFMTTDAGRAAFNVHISKEGSICLSTLQANSTWSPAQSLSSLLISIQSLLSDTTARLDTEANDRYESALQHETIRVAVCDTVDACLRENSPFAPTIRDAVLKKFAQLYDKYEVVVKSRMHLTGTNMNDPMWLNRGTYQFETLLTRLQDLKARLQKKNKPTTAAAAKAEV